MKILSTSAARVVLVALLAGANGLDAQGVAGTQQPDRTALEQRLRQRVAQVTRQRLGLDDARMAQLEGVNSRYAPQIGSLSAQERESRQQLRRQMTSASADQAEVARLLDNLLRLQKQRVSLLESEQRDLAVFLTPVQRARYMGLQAQIRRRVEQLRRQDSPPLGGRARNRQPR